MEETAKNKKNRKEYEEQQRTRGTAEKKKNMQE